MSRYGWLITRDHIHEEYGGTDSDVGRCGPSDLTDEMETRLRAGEGLEWRAYDDDEILYYTGVMIVPDDATEEEVVGPLYDYAKPGAGAIAMVYVDTDGTERWFG